MAKKKAEEPKVSVEMARIDLQATAELVEKAKEAARRLGMSLSAYVRMAVVRQMNRDEGGQQ